MNPTISAQKPTAIKIQAMKLLLKSYSCGLLGAALLALNASPAQAQQTYITCGAVSTNLNAKLKFVNGSNYVAGSGFAHPLIFQRFTNHFTGPGGTFCYSSTNLTFQALSAITNPATAAALGSYIGCKILSVAGPAGGVLSFWESSAGWPTYVFPVGGVYDPAKSMFEVGNIETGANTPGGDPYGNIPGRRFSANQAGSYLVTFQLYDLSKNHPTDTNSPIQAASDPLTVNFVTGTDLATTRFGKTNNVVTLSFTQSGLNNLYVETATDIAGTWVPVAGPFTNAPVGTNITTMLFTNNPTITKVFYRLHGATP
jgi:hypothetical protein